MGRPAILYGGVSQVLTALSCRTRPFSQGRSASCFAMTAAQHWEFSLVKIAVSCVTDRLLLNYSRQYEECARQQRNQEKESPSFRLSKYHSQLLRQRHVADLDSALHLSLHQWPPLPILG